MNETQKAENAAPYSQGVYAGPNTVRAMDYNGHEVLGVRISDELADGSVYLVTVDNHMQLSVAPVLASSIRSYNPTPEEQEEHTPYVDSADYAATRANLERLLEMQLNHPPETTDELRACALTMSDLADVIDGLSTLCIHRTVYRRPEPETNPSDKTWEDCPL